MDDKIELVAESGNNLDTYKALRQKIARTIDESKSGRDIAALSKQLQIVIAKIEELEAEPEKRTETVLDMVRKKHTV